MANLVFILFIFDISILIGHSESFNKESVDKSNAVILGSPLGESENLTQDFTARISRLSADYENQRPLSVQQELALLSDLKSFIKKTNPEINQLVQSTLEQLGIRSSRKCEHSSLANMEPRTVANWVKSNNTNDIGDILCCMPDHLKKDIQLTHSSISAQGGIRVLFGSFRRDQMMFSVSGEQVDGAPQKDAIEYAVDNGEKMDLFDLDLKSGSPHLTKNPESCVSCHGNSDGRYGEHGPRLILDPFPWPRQNPNEISDCPNAQKYGNKMDSRAELSLLKNPRFSCLPAESILNASTGFGEDFQIENKDARRVVNEIKSSPNFEFYQFLILGAAMGCFDSSRTDQKMNDWIPKFAADRMNNPINLRPEIRDKNLSEYFNLVNAKMDRQLAQRRQQDRRLVLPNFNDPASFKPIDQNLTKFCEKDPAGGSGISSSQRIMLRNSFVDSPLRAHILDEIYRTGRVESGIKNGIFRGIFETRGIDTSRWDIGLTMDERDPALTDISIKLSAELGYSNPTTIDSSEFKKRCEDLRIKSKMALDSSRFRASSRHQEEAGRASGQ